MFRLRRGDWVLGAWAASGVDLVLTLLVTRVDGVWSGRLVRTQVQGRKANEVTAPLESDEDEVDRWCNKLVDAYLEVGLATRKVWIEIKSDDWRVVKRRLGLVPWLA